MTVPKETSFSHHRHLIPEEMAGAYTSRLEMADRTWDKLQKILTGSPCSYVERLRITADARSLMKVMSINSLGFKQRIKLSHVAECSHL